MAADTVAKELLDFDRAMEEAERTKKLHQAAFRAAFNYLDAFYPPRDDLDYWMKAAEECGRVAAEHYGNPLIVPLMVAMVDYLEAASKERNNGKTA